MSGELSPKLVQIHESLSLLSCQSKEIEMDAHAKLTSKGQVTIPKQVRDALGLREGDDVLFRVEESQATISKSADFLALASAVPVPASKKGTSWDEVLRRTRQARYGNPR